MTESVRVAVRVRPFNQREKDRNARLIIDMEGATTTITNPEDGDVKKFTFDFSYWSHDGFLEREDGYSYPDGPDSKYSDQEKVFKDLGKDVLANAFGGYNVSLFAYGQTGSGKSYSMVGYGMNKGIIPQVTDDIFKQIEEAQKKVSDEEVTYSVEASMMEIYMEKIRDLFNPKNNPQGGLKVRENPKTGPYVDGLAKLVVNNYEEIDKLMEDGSKARTVASTNMNATSSRAHTVFTMIFTQTKVNKATMKATDKVSKINLVDLAGSERADSTGATGDRLKEGSAINKSLSALGNCISALADASKPGKKGKPYIPYRDSVLTWLLKESLGGNAKTIMIAALSPAHINFDETLSTLRYADRAKQIQNKAVVNEDPNEKLIRELREEIEALRAALGGAPLPAKGGAAPASSQQEDAEKARLKAQLEESQRLIKELGMTRDEKVAQTADVQAARTEVLQSMGLHISEEDKKTPQLVNLNEDPLMSGTIFYLCKPGDTRVGKADDANPPQVALKGLNISKDHATIVNNNGECTLIPGNGVVYLNGTQSQEAKVIEQGDRLIFGNNHVFKFYHPELAAKKREERNKWAEEHPDEPLAPEPIITWEYAQREYLAAQGQLPAVNDEDQQARLAEMKAMEEKMEAEKKEQQKLIEQQKEEFDKKQADLQKKMQKKEKEMKKKLKGANQDELDRKLAELEAQMAREKEQAQKEFEDRQREMEEKQRDLDIALEKQKEQERYKRSLDLIDEKLLKVIPMINDANIIAYELEKFVEFNVKIMERSSKLTKEKKTEVFVKATNNVTESAMMWGYEKFIDRFYLMQELYNEFQEYGELPTRDLMDDPFYDPPEDTLVGTANVYLESLGYLIDIEETTPIIDYKGKEEGEIIMKLSFLSADDKPWKEVEDAHDRIEDLLGKKVILKLDLIGARGIREQMAHESFLKFNFFLNSEPIMTQRMKKRTINPQFNFSHELTIDPVTEDFARYLYTESLELELWGKTADLTEDMLKEAQKDTGETPRDQRPRGKSVLMTAAQRKATSTTLNKPDHLQEKRAAQAQGHSTTSLKSQSTSGSLPAELQKELEEKQRLIEEQEQELERQKKVAAAQREELEEKDRLFNEELKKANPDIDEILKKRDEMARQQRQREVQDLEEAKKSQDEKIARMERELKAKQEELERAKKEGGSRACIIL